MLSSGKFLNKKIVFILVVVLILIIGGIFLWINKPKEIKGSPDDYVIKETQEGIVVENSRAGLRFKVPDGWKARKVEVEEGSVVLYSPDAESVYQGKIRPPLKKGCMIEIAVIYKSMSIDELEEKIREMHTGPTVESDKIFSAKINHIHSLRNEFLDKVLGYGNAVYIPTQNKVYSICIYSNSQDAKACNETFNKFLDTLSFE
ncbi:hypothetical protein J7K03_02630 [bacterium]|nr:hypothetical protein [bacterium]